MLREVIVTEENLVGISETHTHTVEIWQKSVGSMADHLQMAPSASNSTDVDWKFL